MSWLTRLAARFRLRQPDPPVSPPLRPMPELVAGLAVAPPFTPEPAHPADPIDAELWKRWREFCRIHSEPGWERFCAVYAVHEANLAAEAARLEAELRQLPPFERFVP